MLKSQSWRHRHGRLEQENHKFKANLDPVPEKEMNAKHRN